MILAQVNTCSYIKENDLQNQSEKAIDVINKLELGELSTTSCCIHCLAQNSEQVICN